MNSLLEVFGDLQIEGAVVGEEVVHLAQELVVVADADVLSHLDGRDHLHNG